MHAELALYRWTVRREPDPSIPGAPFRALEALVSEAISGTVQDPVVREHATSYSIVKLAPAEARAPAEVILTIVAPPAAEAPLTRVVGRRLAEYQTTAHPVALDDPILHPIASEYRHGLADITDISLDLHPDTPAALRNHQCALLRIACRPIEPRFELHPYLLSHSPTYTARSGMHPDGKGWSWDHEQCWGRFYTPGPAPNLPPPLHCLWNIVLGLAPRRWDDPKRLATRLGIDCS